MEKIETKNGEMFIYTEEQLMARLKFFIGICLALTLTGIVFVVLYSLIFVTQPMNAIAPIDQKFFELIIPIATFLTGTLSGIMLAGSDKDARMEALKAANKAPTISPTSTSGNNAISGLNSFASGINTNAKSPASVFTTTTSSSPFASSIMTSSAGKPMPVQPDQPEL